MQTQLGWGIGLSEEGAWLAFIALKRGNDEMIPILKVTLDVFEEFIEEREHMRAHVEPLVPVGRFGEFLHQTEVLRPIIAHLRLMVDEGASDSSIIAQLAEYNMDTTLSFERAKDA
ncbi:hypothetical protein LCGC14_1906960 [marine sediment metagenome]|uniref:Uncharacterized protein n=1 Tax=marine sediment metagenome TaxID=412755 RepID=A0A0F9ISY8_9ZZZZ